MCFAPQRRALFRHLNFQKWSESGVLCTFWLGNVLRATTACTFRHLNFQKWSEPLVFLTLTSKCAWRHNGVQLFISHLPRCLRTRRFSEPTFQPSGATKPRKNTVFRAFPTFSRTCIFFVLIFSLLTLLPADCFFISPYCRKFDFQTSVDCISCVYAYIYSMYIYIYIYILYLCTVYLQWIAISVGRSRVFVIEGAPACPSSWRKGKLSRALRVGPVLGWLALDCSWFI